MSELKSEYICVHFDTHANKRIQTILEVESIFVPMDTTGEKVGVKTNLSDASQRAKEHQ